MAPYMGSGIFSGLVLLKESRATNNALEILDMEPKITYNLVANENGCPAFPTISFVRCMEDRHFGDIVQSDFKLSVRFISVFG